MKMNKIKFGIIGYGNIGKRHAQHIIKHPEAILTSICEVAGFEFEEELPPTIKRYDRIEDMLQEGEIDVVNVCTPNYLHHPHTLMSLEAGKHVVCEKPMAISSEECEDMIQKANQVNKTIFVSGKSFNKLLISLMLERPFSSTSSKRMLIFLEFNSLKRDSKFLATDVTSNLEFP